jgi:hypothetical protein
MLLDLRTGFDDARILGSLVVVAVVAAAREFSAGEMVAVSFNFAPILFLIAGIITPI